MRNCRRRQQSHTQKGSRKKAKQAQVLSEEESELLGTDSSDGSTQSEAEPSETQPVRRSRKATKPEAKSQTLPAQQEAKARAPKAKPSAAGDRRNFVRMDKKVAFAVLKKLIKPIVTQQHISSTYRGMNLSDPKLAIIKVLMDIVADSWWFWTLWFVLQRI